MVIDGIMKGAKTKPVIDEYQFFLSEVTNDEKPLNKKSPAVSNRFMISERPQLYETAMISMGVD